MDGIPFDLPLSLDALKGVGERGLVLYRPLGIHAGVGRHNSGTGSGSGGAGEWGETVRNWRDNATINMARDGGGMGMDEEEGGDEGRFEALPDDHVGVGYDAPALEISGISGVQDGVGYESGIGVAASGDGDVEMD